jgi:hypothetical protein
MAAEHNILEKQHSSHMETGGLARLFGLWRALVTLVMSSSRSTAMDQDLHFSAAHRLRPSPSDATDRFESISLQRRVTNELSGCQARLCILYRAVSRYRADGPPTRDLWVAPTARTHLLPESVEAALLSPVSTAARNNPNRGPRIALKASVTPAPRARIRRVSPSRRSGLVASAARVFGSQVRLAVAPGRIPRDTEALREAALQRPEPPAASKDFEPSKNRFKINRKIAARRRRRA